MFKFIIDRPILAFSLSTLIVVLGLVSLKGLPLSNYPRVSPPTINIFAYYPGADAATVSDSVAAVLERQINGAEGMLYISSKCFNNGAMNMNVTFDVDRDDDLALVDVQNRVGLAEAQLPQEVTRQGLTIKKQSPDMLMLISLYSPKGTVSDLDLANYASRNIKDALGRINGVGQVMLIGAGDYGLRLWLDPARLANYNLTVSDVRAAVNDQNQLAPAGSFGAAPSSGEVQFERTAQVQGRLTTPDEFGNLVLRTNDDGSLVRLRDVTPSVDPADAEGRNSATSPGIELGAFSYVNYSRLDGQPSASIVIYQLPSGNAVEISQKARELMDGVRADFQKIGADMDYSIGLDMAEFVTESLNELIKTLFEALGLVLIVVYLFLGSFRSSLVPMVAVPVSLIGVFAFFPALGLNINNLTLFALVLAVGIVVDDAIVVVEAVEVHLEKGLSPRQAAIAAMDDVGLTIIGITFALVSVFLPLTILGGLTGKLYQQFALTLALSVLISSFNSLTLSPALCALILKPKDHQARPSLPVRLFNCAYRFVFAGYNRWLGAVARRTLVTIVIFVAVYAALAGAMKILPTSLVPPEDQRVFFMAVQMPNGTAQHRTIDMTNAISKKLVKEIPEIESVATMGGTQLASGAQSSSVSTLVVLLKNWEERQGPGQDATSLIARSQKLIADNFREPLIMAFNVPTISGLGMGLGLTLEAENRGSDTSPEALAKAANQLRAALAKAPELAMAYTSFSMQGRMIKIEVDREKAKTSGLALSNVFDTLGTILGGSYINDFQEFGHTYKVMMQGRDSYRDTPDNLRLYNVRNSRGELAPISSVLTWQDKNGPEFLTRYNLYPTVEFQAAPAPGYSSGQAMEAMLKAAGNAAGPDFGFEWTDESFQEVAAAGQTPVVLALAFICCFLVLAALYESLTSPAVVMLSVAIAVLGAVVGQLGRGLTMDVFMQVGLVMLIGLAAKNAILIVQFAMARQAEGLSPAEAALEAGQQRFRPILMTSFAFILGVFPLVIASGAGANSRHSLGTPVFFGMIAATAIGVFAIPGLYVLVQKINSFYKPKA